MIARVIPLLRLPRNLDFFDYTVPDQAELEPGSLVTVNFRRRDVVGMVLSIAKTSSLPPAKLKPLKRILSKRSILPAHLFDILTYLSRESLTSPAMTLRSILPTFRLRDELELAPAHANRRLVGPDPKVLIYRYEATKHARLKAIADETAAAGRSMLIVVPQQSDVEAVVRQIPGSTVFDRAAGLAPFRQAYLSVMQSRGIVVVGTRSSIFAPITDLGTIVIVDEEADELIQDEPNPRYDARAAAMIAARYYGAQLILMSRLPSLVTWQAVTNRETIDEASAPPSIFTDLEEARRGRDYDIITERNRERINQALENKQRVLIIHARAALFGSLECRDCGYVATCPTCAVPFRVLGDQLVCRHCGTQSPIPSQCPTCRSVRLRGRGQGLPFVADLLRGSPRARITLDPSDRRGNIVLVTPTELRFVPDSTFTLALITRYDSLIGIPRYDADERTRRILYLAAAKLNDGGRLIIQASPIFQDIIKETFSGSWRHQSLAAAERYGYPPAWRMMQLRRRASSQDPDQSAEAVARRLRRADPKLLLTGPLPARARSRTDQGGSQLLLRYKQHLPAAVRTILVSLDDHWTVTLDPRELQ